MPWIQPLAELTLADIDRVGGKAAHLGALMRAGFNVPKGFVIDVEAFTSHFGLVTDPLVRPVVPRLHAEFMAQIVAALIAHLGDVKELAVRSSSTQEDSNLASFAGQHSTYYFVAPQRIDQAIVDCWMSLWSQAALAYRRAGWAEIASGEPVRMAIIVQQMLPATRSGVAFSRDPITGAHECVIEATWGLGAALMDGRVSPDHARVSEAGELISYNISDKQYQVSGSPSNLDGNRLQEVSVAQRHQAVLSTLEAERLANISQQLEVLFEQPQDIEWSYVDEQLYLLQSRPITSQAKCHNIDKKLVLFKPLAENFTEPLTPLTQDLFSHLLPSIGAFYNGRFYIDADIISALSPWVISDTEIADLMLLRHRPKRLKLSITKLLKSASFFALAFLMDGANWIRAARSTPESLQGYRRTVDKIIQQRKLGIAQTMHRLVWGRGFFEPMSNKVFVLNISAGRYFLYIGILNACVARFAPQYPIKQLSKTYHGRYDMQSLQLLEELRHLSQDLDEALHSDSNDAQQIKNVLSGQANTLPHGHPFTIAFDKFISNFGHRGPREMEVAAPRWRETPKALLELLRATPAQADNINKTHGSYLAARDELHAHLKPWQRKFVEHLCNKIAHYTALRENTRHYHIMAFAAIRQKLLDEERQLIENAKLTQNGDIFFLTISDIKALADNTKTPEDAQTAIRLRRRQWHRRARGELVECINIEASTYTNNNLPENMLHGQCASPGYCEGKARVIFSPQQAKHLQPGEILVAPYTDPAWTPLFIRASGIIVETGSFLSHAGTIARELHVPCIVDVKGCTQEIKTGQLLRLNATNGTIETLI